MNEDTEKWMSQVEVFEDAIADLNGLLADGGDAEALVHRVQARCMQALMLDMFSMDLFARDAEAQALGAAIGYLKSDEGNAAIRDAVDGCPAMAGLQASEVFIHNALMDLRREKG